LQSGEQLAIDGRGQRVDVVAQARGGIRRGGAVAVRHRLGDAGQVVVELARIAR
jgi:hypothetical protein